MKRKLTWAAVAVSRPTRAGAAGEHGHGEHGGLGARHETASPTRRSSAHAASIGLLPQAEQRGEFVHPFAQTGTVDFACLVPGHAEAGMIGTIEVIQLKGRNDA